MGVDVLVFLFTDIEGSSKLWEEHTEAMTPVIARHDEILQQTVRSSGGRITKHTGDGITAVFEGGQPLAGALEAQKRFAAEPWGEIGELRIRAGLHAGEAEFLASAGTADGDYFGPAVNATARVMSAAWGGQILLTPEVTSISPLPSGATLLDLGDHLLKNVSVPQKLYQLVHPRLPWHEFPPPRTLSGQSIRQAVDERGNQMAGLEPRAMGIALVAATLLPALQGELDPEEGALEGNLGVLEDLGALSLRRLVVDFAERLRGATRLAASELQVWLQDELQTQWQAGDDSALALRTDASRLLQAVDGVEAAMTAAKGEIKDALARGLADLGGQFGEFRWVLADVRDSLAEVRARQALQLALQREQLDLQRQQLVKTNLLLHRQRPGPAIAELTVEGEMEEPPPAEVACPYMGLAAFEAEDAEYFFGREELVAELTARLAGTRFLAVVGPSGSGKSSVVRAGLLPALWAGALPGSEDWHTLIITPGAHPLSELAARLSLLCDLTPGAILRDLETDSRGLELAVRRVLADQPDRVKLLLVVDQFEEIFALCRDEEERQRFVEALLYAVEAEGGCTVVVPTVRADFYGRCADYPRLAARMSDGLLVGPMSDEELRAAIEQPVVVVGLRLEPGLADVILDDVAGEPGALPLMSHALLETFERRRGAEMTHSGYTASGGVAGAIAQTADTVYGSFSAQEQAIVRNIFLRLTELGEEGTQDTRRRVAPGELVRRAEEAAAVEAVLKTLADARLITTGGGPVPLVPSELEGSGAEGTVEVAHEALIREWPALRGWLEEDREGLRIHRHLTEAATEWAQLDREPGELYRGARLAAAGEWAETHNEALNSLEREFLAASRELAEQEEAEREAQRQRELEAARALAAEQKKRAEEQARSAGRLRQRALLLGLALVVALLAVGAAAFLWNRSAKLATENAAVASTAQVAQGQEAAARATAVAESKDRATAQAEADAAAIEASRQRDTAQQAYSLSLIANARQVQEDEDMELALLLALAANSIEDPPAAAQRALLDIAYAPATRRQYVTDLWNFGLDVSPDGKLLLVGSEDGTVFLWDVASGELLRRLEGHSLLVQDVAFSPDGRRALSGSADQTAILWDVASGNVIQRLVGHTANVRAVAFGPDGRTALTGGFGGGPGELILWDLETDDADRRIIRRFGAKEEEHRQGVRAVAISPDGRTALVGLGASPPHDRPLVLWDLETFQVLRFLQGHTSSVNAVAISSDGRLGLGGSASEQLVSLWDLETGEELLCLEGHESPVVGVAFSPDERTALSTDVGGMVIWWDLETGEAIRHLRGHSEASWDADFVDNASAVSSSHDGTLRLWDLTSAFQLQHWGDTELRHTAAVTALAISPDGEKALSGAGTDSWIGPVAADNSLILWDYQTGKPLRRLDGHQHTVSDVVFSADGRQALSDSYDGTLILWDLDTGDAIRRLEGHSHAVTGVDISSDGRYALSSALDGTVILWHLPTGEVVRRFTGHQSTELSDIAFGADDLQAVSSAFDNSLIVWDVGSGQRVRRLTGLTGRVGWHSRNDIGGVVWSPDGRTVLSAGAEGILLQWDLASGQSIRRFEGHATSVTDVMVSPDGQTALSGGGDGSLILWDMASGTPIRSFHVNASLRDPASGFYGTQVAVHPGGQTAISGEPDGTILKWQLAEPSPAELIAWIGNNRHLRELTCQERETYQITPVCDGEGVSAATTTDLLAAAAQAATSSQAAALLPSITPSATIPPSASPTPRPTRLASLGENRGELTRFSFDVWTYQGRAGEVLTLHMEADKPITEWIPVEERFEAGVLDPVLIVIAPDGNLLALADDAPSKQTVLSGDSLIEAVYLPVDGEYRIEAQSYLDDLAGGYTLTVESREVDIDPVVLQDYVGRYNSPWGVRTVLLEDGRLYFVYWPQRLTLDPISETEFIANPQGWRVTFTRGDDGRVAGFDLTTTDALVQGSRLEE